MSSIPTLYWASAYLAIALLFAMGSIAATAHQHNGDLPSIAVRGMAAAVAGMLWPMVLAGMAQVWLIRAAVDLHRNRRAGIALESASHPVGRLMGAH